MVVGITRLTAQSSDREDEEMKWIGIILLIAGLSCAAYFGSQRIARNPADAEVFHELWQKDIVQLKESKKLPEGWNSLRLVEYTPLDQETTKWIENKKPDFDLNAEGQFKLEILLDHFEDEEGKAALIEYHLIDLNSGNKVWELGRTVKINTDNLAKPESVATETNVTPAPISQ
jgi:hypothetical protein